MKLNSIEIEYVKGQIRQDLRRQDRNASQLTRKFGNEANLTNVNSRREWLETFYTKLGGKVNQIANRRQK